MGILHSDFPLMGVAAAGAHPLFRGVVMPEAIAEYTQTSSSDNQRLPGSSAL
jgi:hypothetical protein